MRVTTHPMISSRVWLLAAVMAGVLTPQCSCTVLLLRLGWDTTSTDSSYVPVLGSNSPNLTIGPISCAEGKAGSLPVRTQPLASALLAAVAVAAAAVPAGGAAVVPAAVLKLGACLQGGKASSGGSARHKGERRCL